MFLISLFLVILSFILYAILEPEKESYDGFSGLFFVKFLVKFVYRAIRYRKQGTLSLPKDLIYVAGGGSSSMCIEPKNHHLKINGVRINSMNLKKYRTLCGYKRYDAGVPVCYAESLFVKGLYHIITSSKFCLSPMGLIHLRQTIKQIEPLEEYLNNVFALHLRVQEYRQLQRGVEVDINLQLIVNDRRPVWEGTVTLFSKGGGLRKRPVRNQSFNRDRDDDTFDEVIEVDVPGDCGLQYAKLSGDWNPFHLFKWSAKLFGFRLPIAHGMWTLSKALSYFQSKGYDLYERQTEVSCSFKRPLFMPGRANLKIKDFQELYGDEGVELIVEDRDTGVPHLKATVKVM